MRIEVTDSPRETDEALKPGHSAVPIVRPPWRADRIVPSVAIVGTSRARRILFFWFKGKFAMNRLLPKTALTSFTFVFSLAWGLLTASSADAQTWTGSSSNDFGTATNWNPATVPSHSVATFASSSINQVSINQPSFSLLGFVFAAGAPSYTITITNNGVAFSGNGIVDNSGTIQNLVASSGGYWQFENSASAGDVTLTVNTGSFIQFFNTSSGATAQIVVNGGTVADETSGSLSIGSLSGSSGDVLISNVGGGSSQSLTIGGLNRNTIFGGTITESGATGQLIKSGTGTLTLTGVNTYTGGTTVSSGNLQIEGSIGAVTLDEGVLQVDGSSGNASIGTGILRGVGTVGTITTVSGSTIAPGNAASMFGALNSGTATFASGSTLEIRSTDGRACSSLNSSGTMNLSGTLHVHFENKPTIGNVCTIANAAGDVNLSFASIDTAPANVQIVYQTTSITMTVTGNSDSIFADGFDGGAL
jgi:autotransporter-associated beta strand protein